MVILLKNKNTQDIKDIFFKFIIACSITVSNTTCL